MLHFNVWIKLNSFSLNFSWMGVVTVVAHHPRNTHTQHPHPYNTHCTLCYKHTMRTAYSHTRT